MTSLDDPVLKGRIDAYLTRLRRALVNLPPAEVAEIVREIHGHIVERVESTDSPNEAALTRILGALGNPEDIGSLYQSRAMVARARASTSPLLILRTTVRWAAKSIAGLAMSIFALFGYANGISWLIGATMKVIRPDRVGLWVGPHTWNLSMGSLTLAERTREHATEVLGWWFIPVMLIVGPLILIVTTVIVRWALRFAFRAQRSAPSPLWRWRGPATGLARLLRRNLLAEAVFLPVQHPLLGLREMAAILAGHVTLFLAHLVIFPVRRGGLAAGHRAVLHVIVNATILVVQAMIDLGAARMALLPIGFGRSAAGHAREQYRSGGEGQGPVKFG